MANNITILTRESSFFKPLFFSLVFLAICLLFFIFQSIYLGFVIMLNCYDVFNLFHLPQTAHTQDPISNVYQIGQFPYKIHHILTYFCWALEGSCISNGRPIEPTGSLSSKVSFSLVESFHTPDIVRSLVSKTYQNTHIQKTKCSTS